MATDAITTRANTPALAPHVCSAVLGLSGRRTQGCPDLLSPSSEIVLRQIVLQHTTRDRRPAHLLEHPVQLHLVPLEPLLAPALKRPGVVWERGTGRGQDWGKLTSVNGAHSHQGRTHIGESVRCCGPWLPSCISSEILSSGLGQGGHMTPARASPLSTCVCDIQTTTTALCCVVFRGTPSFVSSGQHHWVPGQWGES